MSDLFSLAAARKLRDEGMERSAYGYNAQEWLVRARDMALLLAGREGEVSADKVLQFVPRPPEVSVNATGSIFKDKRFKLVGYKMSSKVSAHARRIAVWALNDV